jgi:hypothetical protein
MPTVFTRLIAGATTSTLAVSLAWAIRPPTEAVQVALLTTLALIVAVW